jgi:putative lipoic acid-binding regulatory protein
MNDPQQETLLEFPCDFTLKVMGQAAEDFDSLVVSLVRQHCSDIAEGAVSSRSSKGGKYLSVSVTITATSKQQLDNIYQSLTDHPRVLMSL